MSYRVSRADGQTIEAAKLLLWKTVRSRLVTPDDLMALARALKVLQELPAVSAPEKVSIELGGPAKRYEQKEVFPWWTITVDGTAISISSGVRHGGASADGEIELAFHWSIKPESESTARGVLAELGVYDEDIGFPAQVREIHLEEAGYRLRITSAEAEAERREKTEQPAAGVDESEVAISRHADFGKAAEKPQFHFSSPQRCNLCGIDLTVRSFFVDGQVGHSGEWRDMCSQCFFAKGAKIGWGKGQLYQRQPDGRWLLVGGFPP